MTGANREYKDGVFTMLFKEKENLISLYNPPSQPGTQQESIHAAWSAFSGREVRTGESGSQRLCSWISDVGR